MYSLRDVLFILFSPFSQTPTPTLIRELLVDTVCKLVVIKESRLLVALSPVISQRQYLFQTALRWKRLSSPSPFSCLAQREFSDETVNIQFAQKPLECRYLLPRVLYDVTNGHNIFFLSDPMNTAQSLLFLHWIPLWLK